MSIIAPKDTLIRYVERDTVSIVNGNSFDLEILNVERTLFGFKIVFIEHDKYK